ncbi:MAG: universal stress protein [Micropruina sp.]
MKILIWVREGTWPACVDAARDLAGSQPAGTQPAEVTLICVREQSPGPPDPGFGSLIGLGRRQKAAEQIDQLSREAAETMLSQARERLGQDAAVRLESGFPERVVTAAADGTDYLILGRDGDRSRLGPSSLGKHTRFVVDHAPCRVLLIWPDLVPDLGSIPPPPPDR